jgi:hypothetical protein
MLNLDRFRLFAGVVFTAVAGCTTAVDNKRYDLGISPEDAPLANSAAYRDTIGSLGYFEGMAAMRVRGYGLVVGLGKNGSKECPRRIYDKLVQSIYKHQHVNSSPVGAKEISPERLIEDLDTAVVIVTGEIPPAAVRGNRFDVLVTALPGTETKSLRGGRLYTTELEMYRDLPSGISVMGRELGKAAGPVFLNPFSDEQSATKANLLQGVIVNGGIVTQDRRVRFVLSQPSYRWARQVEARINAQFSGTPKTADAVSPSFISLNVPDEFSGDTEHFLELVRGLYLSHDPQFEAARARELAQEIIGPSAPHARIALCFEGLGRAASPVLSDLCENSKDYVSFHAAAAGLRLGDHVACDRMTLHAADQAGKFRFRAIEELGRAKGMAAAAVALRKLLDDSDPRIQVAAYEGLVAREDRTIESHRVAEDNFWLDLVPSASKPFVYVKRQGQRRIALFGDGIRCQPPVLYRAPDGSITINAGPEDPTLTVLRTVVTSGTTSPPMPAPFELDKLVGLLGADPALDARGAAKGFGLDYGAIARALYHLCETQAVNATFVLEQPNVTELFGAAEAEGRAESEL